MRFKPGPEVGNFPSNPNTPPPMPCPVGTHHRDQGPLNLQRKRLYHILDRKRPRTKKERIRWESSVAQPTTHTCLKQGNCPTT